MNIDQAAPPLRDDLKVAALLGLASAMAVALLFPYLLQLMPEAFEKVKLPLALVIPLQSLQAGFLFTLLAFCGLRMAPRSGLDAPWLRAWSQKRPRPALPWTMSIGWGLAAGGAVIALVLLLDPHLPARLHAAPPQPPTADAFNGFLASFYGGIGEEIQLRLFLMTLIVWLVARSTDGRPSPIVCWSAIVVAALLFGAGHLPAAAELWPLDTFVVFRVVLLNAIAGIVFGWLYWRRGLEAAMIAHFSADIVLHVLAPLVGGTLA